MEFLGFELRRVTNWAGDGPFILLTPRKKARLAVKAHVRETLRRGGATPLKELIAHLNTGLQGWVQYFRVGHASRALSEIRDYVELKVRSVLTRRTRRRKRSVGWRRWSNEYLYDVLGLYWIVLGWETQSASQREDVSVKITARTLPTHNP